MDTQELREKAREILQRLHRVEKKLTSAEYGVIRDAIDITEAELERQRGGENGLL